MQKFLTRCSPKHGEAEVSAAIMGIASRARKFCSTSFAHIGPDDLEKASFISEH
jgi:hypothetical protein